jgi:hypothetical protein
MTAHDTNQPATTTSRPDATPRCPVTRASRHNVTAIVWRITADTVAAADTTMASGAGDSPLTPRLARHLVAIYSDVHDTVVDFDADINVQHAAEAAGRTYSTITNTTALGTATHLPAPARHQPAQPLPAAPRGRRQHHRRRHGHPAGSRRDQLRRARTGPAARCGAAGLRHLHDIVAVDTDDGRDTFTAATNQNAATPGHAGDMRHVTVTTLVISGQRGPRP